MTRPAGCSCSSVWLNRSLPAGYSWQPTCEGEADVMEFLSGLHLWIKALHVISVIAWMAALLYLPRLFVYHAEAVVRSEASETFKVMERRLLRGIMTPAMIASLFFGALMLLVPGVMQQGWLHVKFVLLIGMFGLHGFFSRCQRDFAEDRNRRSARSYRWLNEAPAVLMVFIVLLAVAKPF